MRINTIIELLIFLVLSVTLVISLYLVSGINMKQGNDFKRLLPPHPVTKTESFDLLYNSFYFSGYDNNKVYLGNVTAPLYLIELDLKTMDTLHWKVHVENMDTLRLRNNTRVGIYPPYFYIMDGSTPQLYKGNVGEWIARQSTNDSIFFSKAVPMSPKSLAIRTVSSKTGEYILGKLYGVKPRLYLNSKLLEKQVDGIFCTDGMLHYNRDLNKLLYLYHYRNQFMVMDTTMTHYEYGHTIDTNSRAKIQATGINKGKSVTMSAPPLMVNRLSTTFGNLLFVNSALMAGNETRASFEKAAVVDVYHLQKKTYEFSFYIDHINGSRLTDLIVVNAFLITLHGKQMSVHTLEPVFFDKLK